MIMAFVIDTTILPSFDDTTICLSFFICREDGNQEAIYELASGAKGERYG
jgi:hypothetical protein